MDVFTVADLFVVGLAFDLVGAYLLSRGLLASHHSLAVHATSYWGGNPTVAVGLAEDRVDGRFGLLYLALGFAVQAVGYLLDLALDPSTDASLARAIVAGGLAVASGGGAYLLWKRRRRTALKGTLIEMARYDTSSAKGPPIRADAPYADVFDWAAVAGIPPEELGVQGAVRPPKR
jgi:LPXTG-motif cell wall-anchored protein